MSAEITPYTGECTATIDEIIMQSNAELGYVQCEDVVPRPSRLRRAVGRTVAAGLTAIGLISGPIASDSLIGEAAAASPTCYGDYCSGQYPDVAHCDEDAHTIAEASITRPGIGLSIEAKMVTIGVGNTDPNEVARLKLRASDRCGTVWGLLNAKSGSRLDFWGIMNVGVQQDGGYTQDRNIDGNLVGAPAAVSFSPMVYGRSRDYRAMVDIKNFGFPVTVGTYWIEGPK